MAIEFHTTRRGSKFYDFDVPKLAEQLERIANAMEAQNKIEEKKLLLEQKKYLNENKNARTTGSGSDSDESTQSNS
jgi:hypothetical protein